MNECAFAQARENREYCRSNGRVVLLMVDVTTPYDQTDKDIIIRMTDQILSTINKGDKLVIRTISDSYIRVANILPIGVSPVVLKMAPLEDYSIVVMAL